MLPKMPFGLSLRRKCLGRLRAQSAERGLFARVFFPFLHHRRITNDLDLVLVFGKTHPPTETLLVKISQSALIIVMVGRTEQRSTQPASRDVGKVSFNRLRLGDVDLIKIGLRQAKRAPFEKFAID